jgi:tetratricopeptide (TPR) repeat protein
MLTLSATGKRKLVSRVINSLAPRVVNGGCCARTQEPTRSSATRGDEDSRMTRARPEQARLEAERAVRKPFSPSRTSCETTARPCLAEAYSGLAMIYQLQANTLIVEENFGLASESLERAQSYAETALRYDSTDAGVLNQLGYTENELARCYTAAGRGERAYVWLEKARSHFKQVLGLDANDASAHNGLGSVALLRGSYDEAVNECMRAISLQPKYLFAQHDLAGALYSRAASSEDPSATIDDLRRFVQTARTVFQLDGDPEAGRLPPETRQSLEEACAAAITWLDEQGVGVVDSVE